MCVMKLWGNEVITHAKSTRTKKTQQKFKQKPQSSNMQRDEWMNEDKTKKLINIQAGIRNNAICVLPVLHIQFCLIKFEFLLRNS